MRRLRRSHTYIFVPRNAWSQRSSESCLEQPTGRRERAQIFSASMNHHSRGPRRPCARSSLVHASCCEAAKRHASEARLLNGARVFLDKRPASPRRGTGLNSSARSIVSKNGTSVDPSSVADCDAQSTSSSKILERWIFNVLFVRFGMFGPFPVMKCVTP